MLDCQGWQLHIQALHESNKQSYKNRRMAVLAQLPLIANLIHPPKNSQHAEQYPRYFIVQYAHPYASYQCTVTTTITTITILNLIQLRIDFFDFDCPQRIQVLALLFRCLLQSISFII